MNRNQTKYSGVPKGTLCDKIPLIFLITINKIKEDQMEKLIINTKPICDVNAKLYLYTEVKFMMKIIKKIEKMNL